MFANGGRAEWYIGSADLMERNLDRRVEVVTPVEDHEAQARLARIIEVMLADDRRSWQLGPDGRWRRTEIVESREGTIDTFAVLKEDAARPSRRIATSRAGRSVGRRLDGPARMTATCWSAAADGGRAQVPHDRRRDGRAAARGRRARRASRALGPVETVLHEDRYVDTPTARSRPPGYAGRLRSTATGDGHHAQGPAPPGRRRRGPPARGARGPGRSRRGAGALAGVRGAGRGGRRSPATRRCVDLVALRQVRRKRMLRRRRHRRRGVGRRRRGPRRRAGRRALRRARGSSCARATRSVLEPLADLLGEIEELVAGRDARSSSGRSRSLPAASRASPRPTRPTPRGGGRGAGGRDAADAGRSGAQRRRRRKAAPTAGRAVATRSSRTPTRPAGGRAAGAATRPRSPSRRGSSSPQDARRRSPTTTSPRPAARSSGSTSPGWSPARRAPATGKDAEELHAMRVATRRQRAAWRVFGDAFDPKRTARYRRRLQRGRRRPRRRPRPRRPDRVRRGLPGPPARGRGGRASSRSSGRGGSRRDAARGVLVRELDADRYRRWLDGYLAFVQAEGQGVARRRPDRAAPGARHDAVADLGRVRGRARVRVR